MQEWLLKLLGVKAQQGGSIEHWSITFSNLKTPFQILLFLIATAALAYGVWWFYKREPDYCSLKRRRTLAGLRYAGLLILMFILSGPVLELVLRGYVKGKVVILLDSSKSMTREDKYRRPEDKIVAAQTLNRMPLKESDANKIDINTEKLMNESTRVDMVKAMFNHPDINLLGQLQEKYDVEMWSFARAADMKRLGATEAKVTPAVLDELTPDGAVTELGGAVRETLKRLKGQPLSAIVMVTDGGWNKGEEPTLVAQDSPVRIYPVGIGVPESHDIALTYLFMESKIFVDDLAPIYVRIKQHGFSGEQAQIIVSTDSEELARQTITLRDTSEQTEIVRVKPKKAGKFTYKIEVKPANLDAEDAEPNNNHKFREVEVIDQKINVLLLENEPRWEYRFLRTSLLRDKRVSCNILLNVPDKADLARQSKVFLKEFPTREELFKYHVIIFGNVSNDLFAESDIENLRRFVMEEGGGIWFIADKNNFPDSYKDSKLEILIPIDFERNPEVTAEDEKQTPLVDPFKVVLTPEGRTHSVTRLDVGGADSGDDKNAEYWDLMPPIYWFHRATRAKLGASTLLVTIDENRGGRNEPIPLMVTSQVGRGRVLYQAFRDLWRMRYPLELGPDALERFHGHAIQYLGLSKLLGRTARIEITTDREEYSVGDRVKINARVLTKKDLDYSTAEQVTALITDTNNEANQVKVELTPEPGQRGMYRGEAIAGADGTFRVTLKDEEDEKAYADYKVVIPQVEMESPDMKKELLDNVARSSVRATEGAKAKMYFPNQAGEMIKDLNESQRPVDERKENTLWDAPILLILFTILMGLEWFIRKRSDLL
ncbi:MAG TPA: hypothetical protein VEJ63_04680 [Planctomycetota bacterium]|nr:hypothetical protein [Planctomycetota bacterium]